jgi:LmbE family N-acetylglucosaminyl deacetylase
MSYTLVSFHAHPDDEVLLTAGTLARAAAEGHRVVLVVATAGEAGLSAVPQARELGQIRTAELERSAKVLGCHRVILLGYSDSGMKGEHGGFAALPPQEPAERLAAILREENADVLTVYDANGGYGHPDHIQVHHVGHRAAVLAGTPVVLEATVDRRALLRAAKLVHWTGLAPKDFSPHRMRAAYSDATEITHRVDVRGYLDQKKAAMRAHATQASGGEGQRTLAFCTKLPGPLYRRVFGTEWFVERGGTAATSSDVFSSLR